MNKILAILLLLLLPLPAWATTATDIASMTPGHWLRIDDDGAANQDFTSVYCTSAYADCWSGADPSASGSPWAYSTAIYIPSENSIVNWGGGHSNYSGNELYKYSFNTWSWSMISTTPSSPSSLVDIAACYDGTDCDGYLADGLPEARHTRRMICYDSVENRLYSAGASALACNCTKKEGTTDHFDFDTGVWTEHEDYEDVPFGATHGLAFCDNRDGTVWALGTDYNLDDLSQFDPDGDANGVWTERSSNLGLLGSSAGSAYNTSYDHDNHIFLIYGNADVYKSIDVSDQTSPVITTSYTGDTTLGSTVTPIGGMAYWDMGDNPAVSGLFVAWTRSEGTVTDIYLVHPINHHVVKVPAAAGNTVTPAATYGVGDEIHGKLAVTWGTGASDVVMHVAYVGDSWYQYVYKLSDSQTDTDVPTISTASFPASSTTLSVDLSGVTPTAADSTSTIVGYQVTTSSVKPRPYTDDWSDTWPSSYTVDDYGTHKLYVYTQDIFGNVSVGEENEIFVYSNADRVTAIDAEIANLASGEWYVIPGSRLSDAGVYPDPTPPGTGGVASIITYGGAAYDTSRNRLMLTGGGGDDLYSGNEIYAFDTDTYTWSIIWGPSTNANIPTTSASHATYDDGAPGATRTYDNLVYIPTDDVLFVHHGGNWKEVGGETYANTWLYDITADTWSQADSSSPLVAAYKGGATGYDSVNDEIWMQSGNATHSYDVQTDTWTLEDSETVYGTYAISGAASDDYFVVPGFGKCAITTLSTGQTVQWDNGDFTGDIEILSERAPGITYDSTNDLFVLWAGNRWAYGVDPLCVYVLNPATRAIEKRYPAAGNVVNSRAYIGSGSNTVSGIFGRFQFVPDFNGVSDLDVFIAGPDLITGDVYIYKLSSYTTAQSSSGIDYVSEPILNINVPAISIRWPVSGDSNHNATGTVKYRLHTDTTWSNALDLRRVDFIYYDGGVDYTLDEMVGIVIDLTPGTEYDLLLTITDPDGGSFTSQRIFTTIAWPSEPTGGDTWYAVASGGATSGDCAIGTPCTLAYIQSDKVGPGDIVSLADGTYYSASPDTTTANDPDFSFDVAGTESAGYVWYECESKHGCDLYGVTMDADYVAMKWMNLNMDSCPAVGGSEDVDNIYLYENNMTGGAICHTGLNSLGMKNHGVARSPYCDNWFIRGNVITGDMMFAEQTTTGDGNVGGTTVVIGTDEFTDGSWPDDSFIADGYNWYTEITITESGHAAEGESQTVDDFVSSTGTFQVDTPFSVQILSGVALTVQITNTFNGEGMELVTGSGGNSGIMAAVYDNTISKVSDGFSYPGNNTVVWGNTIYDCVDDCLEADHGWTNFIAYDNIFANCQNNSISLQDLDYGAAWWIIRNQVYGYSAQGAFKIREPGPFFLFQNTFVGWSDFYTAFSDSIYLHWAEMKNNLIVAYDAGDMLDYSSAINGWYSDSDYNAFDYGTDTTPFKYNSINRTFTAWKSVSGQDAHSVDEDKSTLITGIVIVGNAPQPAGTVGLTSVTLPSGSGAIDAGVVLPNITDGYNGSAPDIGASESDAIVIPVTIGSTGTVMSIGSTGTQVTVGE